MVVKGQEGPARGELVALGSITTIFLTTIFPFQHSHSSIVAAHLFKTACELVLPLWLQTTQARCSAPNAV